MRHEPAPLIKNQPLLAREWVAALESEDVLRSRQSVLLKLLQGERQEPAGFLEVAQDEHRISFTFEGGATEAAENGRVADVSPSIDDPAVALYRDVLPNVDLQVHVGAEGPKTFIVLQGPNADTDFRFGIDAPGLELRAGEDGAIDFVDATGDSIARMPQPYAVDSSVDELRDGGAFTDVVRVTLDDATAGVVVSVDPEWLADATYPVYVDPSVAFYPDTSTYGDAFASQAYPTLNFADYVRPDSPYYHEHWLGMDPTNSTNVNHVYLRFDLSSIAATTITFAELRVVPYHQYYNAPTSTTTWVDRVTGSWTESGLTWNNKPASTNIGSAGLVEWQWGNFDVKSTVQAWVSGTYTNYGFKLHENGNNGTYWKRLISYEQGSNRPYLSVTYHVPTTSTTTPNDFTSSKTVAWSYSDTSGHAQSHYQVQVSTSSTFSSILYDSGAVASAGTSHTIPTTLSSGTQYWWRVRAKDGTSWSAYDSTMFVYDAGHPTGTVSVNGGASTTNTSTVRVDLSATDSGTTSTYSNDGRSLTSIVGCGSTTCGSFQTPTFGLSHAEGAVVAEVPTSSWHTITVDPTAGNRSTLAFDVMRESSAATYVGVVGNDNDGFRFELRGTSTLTSLGWTANSTPGSYTTKSVSYAFTPGVWYRFVVSLTGTSGTARMWWFPRDSAMPATPHEIITGVYVPSPRLHLFAQAPAGVTQHIYLDDLKVVQNGSSPYGSGTVAVRLSPDNATWTNWLPYADSIDYTLSAGSGSRTVYAQFRDASGNAPPGSTSNSDSITVAFDNLGRQPQHAFETWDLGAGDEAAVNVATGNLVVSHPLATLPFRGGRLPLVLTYNGQDTANVGLGAGWRLNLQRRLTINGDGSVTFIDGDGSRHTFTSPVVNGTLTTYTRPPTVYANLVKDTSQANQFTLTYRNQDRDRFVISGSEGLLKLIEDRHGNTLTLAYGAGSNLSTLTDPANRQVTFSWDTASSPDLLTSISDWAYVSGGVVQTTATGSQRQYSFFYNSGQLAGWSDPMNTSGSCPTGGSNLTCLSYTSGQLTSIAKTQTYTTLSGGALGTATRLSTTTLGYAGSRVASATDAESNATTFSPDGSDRLVIRRPTTTVTVSFQGTADTYGRVSRVWRQHDAMTPIEQYTTWDSTFPVEPATVTDNYGALLGTPARTMTYTYLGGSLGNLAKLVEPLTTSPATNRWTEYAYNANNDVTEVKVSQDGSTTDRTITRYCYSGASSCPSATGLDLLAEMQSYVDGVGGSGAGLDDHDTDVRTDYAYDAYGQRTDATRHNRDAAGSLLDERNDQFGYDSYGNLAAAIVNYANGSVTSPGDDVTPNASTLARTDLIANHTYDTAGNRVSTADPRRAILAATGAPAADDYVTRWTYDALNQQLSEATPTTPSVSITQKTSSNVIDEFGLIRSSTDFGGLITALEFDRAGRSVKSFEKPEGQSARQTSLTTVDGDGRPTSIKDERQLADAGLGYTAYAYDDLGRQLAVAQAVGTADATETDSLYDALDRRRSLEVGVGSASSLLTTYSYDLGGRTIELDDGFTCSQETFDYRDLALTTVSGLGGDGCAADAEQRTISHTNDALGRLVRDEVTAGVGTGDRTLDDVLDAVGNRRIAATRKGGVTSTTTLTVSLLDQTTGEARPDGSLAKTTYDAAANATDRCFWRAGSGDVCLPVGSSWPVDDPDQVTTTAYDARNQRISLRNGGTSGETTYDPDHNYQVKAIYTPTANGREHQTVFEYDARHRLKGPSDNDPAVTVRVCAADTHHACADTPVIVATDIYAYDDNDSRTRVEEYNGAAAAANRYYCYDARDQLVYRNTGSACSSAANDESFENDAAGNRTKAGTTAFTYTATGQLTKVGAADDLTYDSAGRTRSWEVSATTWYFTYDPEGRLITACKSATCASGSDKVEFTYDGEGHRTKIVATAAGGTATTTEFRYQGDAIVEEKVNGAVARTFVVDDAGSIVKMKIATGGNAGDYLVTWNGHGDALNLLRVKTDGSVEVANTFAYSTWGAPTVDGSHLNSGNSNTAYGDLGFRYLYVGEFDVHWDNDFGMGLAYMHARHYAPALGRFLQPDPDGLEDNLYAYAANNPVTEVDPDGTCFIICQVVVGAIDIEQACDWIVVLGGGRVLLSVSIDQALADYRTSKAGPDLREQSIVGRFPGAQGESLALTKGWGGGRPSTLEEVVLGHLAAGSWDGKARAA